jgi:hypothetical protein
MLLGWLGCVQPSIIPRHSLDNLTSNQVPASAPLLMIPTCTPPNPCKLPTQPVYTKVVDPCPAVLGATNVAVTCPALLADAPHPDLLGTASIIALHSLSLRCTLRSSTHHCVANRLALHLNVPPVKLKVQNPNLPLAVCCQLQSWFSILLHFDREVCSLCLGLQTINLVGGAFAS